MSSSPFADGDLAATFESGEEDADNGEAAFIGVSGSLEKTDCEVAEELKVAPPKTLELWDAPKPNAD